MPPDGAPPGPLPPPGCAPAAPRLAAAKIVMAHWAGHSRLYGTWRSCRPAIRRRCRPAGPLA